MPVALTLLLVAVGSAVFHFLSPWWWTPIASNWHYIDNTLIITFWITGAVFVASSSSIMETVGCECSLSCSD
jgi:cytochrome c oxidase subunit 2